MSITILDFEKPIAEVSSKIEALQLAAAENPELLPQINKLKNQETALREKIWVVVTSLLAKGNFSLVDNCTNPSARPPCT